MILPLIRLPHQCYSITHNAPPCQVFFLNLIIFLFINKEKRFLPLLFEAFMQCSKAFREKNFTNHLTNQKLLCYNIITDIRSFEEMTIGQLYNVYKSIQKNALSKTFHRNVFEDKLS